MSKKKNDGVLALTITAFIVGCLIGAMVAVPFLTAAFQRTVIKTLVGEEIIIRVSDWNTTRKFLEELDYPLTFKVDVNWPFYSGELSITILRAEFFNKEARIFGQALGENFTVLVKEE